MASNSLKTRDWMKTMKQATRIYIFILISKVYQGKYKILGDKHDDTWPRFFDFDWLTINFEIKKTVNFMHKKIIVNDTRQTLTYNIKIVFRVVRIIKIHMNWKWIFLGGGYIHPK